MSIANAFNSYYTKFVDAQSESILAGDGPIAPPRFGSADEMLTMFRNRYREFVGYAVDDEAFWLDPGDRSFDQHRVRSGSWFNPIAKAGLAGAGGLAATAAVGFLLYSDLDSPFASSPLRYSLPTQTTPSLDDEMSGANLSELRAVPSAPESIQSLDSVRLNQPSWQGNTDPIVEPSQTTNPPQTTNHQKSVEQQARELEALINQLGEKPSGDERSPSSSSLQPAAVSVDDDQSSNPGQQVVRSQTATPSASTSSNSPVSARDSGDISGNTSGNTSGAIASPNLQNSLPLNLASQPNRAERSQRIDPNSESVSADVASPEMQSNQGFVECVSVSADRQAESPSSLPVASDSRVLPAASPNLPSASQQVDESDQSGFCQTSDGENFEVRDGVVLGDASQFSRAQDHNHPRIHSVARKMTNFLPGKQDVLFQQIEKAIAK
ncbi:MAG: hypothetical protein ACFE0J_17930 [Elainellaceae cyanobacterium]